MTIEIVSFLLPVYGSAPKISQTLDSILGQTCTDWRLVCVLDGPNPSVAEQVRAAIAPEKLDLIELPQNRGIAYALNIGLAASKTKFIARIDDDDTSDVSRIEEQIAAITCSSPPVLVGSRCNVIDCADEKITTLDTPFGQDVRRQLLERNVVVHSSALFARDLAVGVGGYDPRCVVLEDYDLWLRLAQHGRVEVQASRLIDYRLSAGQLSTKPSNIIGRRLVGVSQANLAAVLSLSPWEAFRIRVAWRIGQIPQVRRAFGRMRNLR